MTANDVVIKQLAVPMHSYEDGASAVEWLCRAFGFEEHGERSAEADGRVTHAELDLDGAHVMLGWPGPDYRGPARHADGCDDARKWSAVPYIVDGVLIYVDDVDAHLEHARAAGAVILREPKDEPYGRVYNAADPEGHRWMFLQAAAR
jgi:uncharacterized glyoxalase superfamily protein PhnB